MMHSFYTYGRSPHKCHVVSPEHDWRPAIVTSAARHPIREPP